jgi:hypothetical protein
MACESDLLLRIIELITALSWSQDTLGDDAGSVSVLHSRWLKLFFAGEPIIPNPESLLEMRALKGFQLGLKSLKESGVGFDPQYEALLK